MGQCAPARLLADSVALNDTTVLGLTVTGIIAARCGDATTADSISTVLGDLERPYLRGANVVGRARIAAAQGKKREAVQLLLDAIAQGDGYANHYHTVFEFASLHDFDPFKAVIKSKD